MASKGNTFAVLSTIKEKTKTIVVSEGTVARKPKVEKDPSVKKEKKAAKKEQKEQKTTTTTAAPAKAAAPAAKSAIPGVPAAAKKPAAQVQVKKGGPSSNLQDAVKANKAKREEAELKAVEEAKATAERRAAAKAKREEAKAAEEAAKAAAEDGEKPAGEGEAAEGKANEEKKERRGRRRDEEDEEEDNTVTMKDFMAKRSANKFELGSKVTRHVDPAKYKGVQTLDAEKSDEFKVEKKVVEKKAAAKPAAKKGGKAAPAAAAAPAAEKKTEAAKPKAKVVPLQNFAQGGYRGNRNNSKKEETKEQEAVNVEDASAFPSL